MHRVKKKWGATHGLAPEAILLEDANGTSLSDGSTPEEMGWTIASPSDPPVCTVYAVPNFDEHCHNPEVKAGRPIVARPLAAVEPTVLCQEAIEKTIRESMAESIEESIEESTAEAIGNRYRPSP